MSPLLLKLSTRCLRVEESPVKFLFHCPCLWASGYPVYPYFPVSGEGEKKEGDTCAKMGEQGGQGFPDAHSEWLVGEYLHGHGQSSHFGARWPESASVDRFPTGRDRRRRAASKTSFGGSLT